MTRGILPYVLRQLLTGRRRGPARPAPASPPRQPPTDFPPAAPWTPSAVVPPGPGGRARAAAAVASGPPAARNFPAPLEPPRVCYLSR
jgi:hypothetical protein